MRLWRLLALVAGVLMLLGGLLALLVYLPQLAIDSRGLSPAEKVKAIQDLRGTVLQGLGGVALLGTLYFSARTLELNRRGQVTERFTKAIEQLGQLEDEKLAVRLGGIYALEQIAKDSEDLHWPIMEVFTAFLRVNSIRQLGFVEATQRDGAPETSVTVRGANAPPPVRLPADLQAIATVLGRRTKERRSHEGDRRLDLVGVKLPAVELIGAQLQRANLDGAELQGADLRGAQLQKAGLLRAQLQTADLTGAQLQGAYLLGAYLDEATLLGAQLQGTYLDGAQLNGADLTDAHGLTRGQLKAAVCDERTQLPPDMGGACPGSHS